MSLERIENLLLRLLDTSRTMIDLAYSSLLYNDRVFAEEVLRLEEEVDELHTEFELEVLRLKE
ncbi:MAG: potassium channel protein, partial [Candidatus Methanomethylicota archaeon]